jgi:addiction module HigA family antidote
MLTPRKPGAALLEAGIIPTAPGTFFARRILPAKGQDVPQAAEAMGLQAFILEDLVAGYGEVDADFAVRLSVYTGMSAQSWLNMQDAYRLALSSATERESQAGPGSFGMTSE